MALLETMREEWALLLMVVTMLLLVVALLCGDWPIFYGSPVRSIHLWMTGGACDCVQRILQMLCGERGIRAYEFVEDFCCERPNPILQLFYLAITLGSFFVFYQTSFQYIPGLYVASYHRYLGFFSVLLGLGIFFTTCLCDPGTLTASNVALHKNTYPYDGTIYVENTCSTCKIPRPARSKHCGICNRCVARFDHHCGWMNTCIGANNLRYFLTFLAWHCVLCWYGAYLLFVILAGEVERHRVVQRIEFYYGMSSFYPHLLQWLLSFYHPQVLLLMFLVIVSILLVVFLGYHLLLVARNTTTNEVYKLDAYKRAYAAAVAEELRSRPSSEGNETSSQKSCNWLSCGFWKLGNSRNRDESLFPVAESIRIYNKGLVNNFCEVLFPKCQMNKQD